jgi:hypothetical protein
LPGIYPLSKKLVIDACYQGPQFHKALAKILPAKGNHHDLKQEVTQLY